MSPTSIEQQLHELPAPRAATAWAAFMTAVAEMPTDPLEAFGVFAAWQCEQGLHPVILGSNLIAVGRVLAELRHLAQ